MDRDLDIIKHYIQLALENPPASMSRDQISELSNAIKSLDERLARLEQMASAAVAEKVR